MPEGIVIHFPPAPITRPTTPVPEFPLFAYRKINPAKAIDICLSFIKCELNEPAVLSSSGEEYINFKFEKNDNPRVTTQFRPFVCAPKFSKSPYWEVHQNGVPSVEKTRSVLQLDGTDGTIHIFRLFVISENQPESMDGIRDSIISAFPATDSWMFHLNHIAVCLASRFFQDTCSPWFSPLGAIEAVKTPRLDFTKSRLLLLRRCLPKHLRYLPRFCLARTTRLRCVGGISKLPPLVASDIEFTATAHGGVVVSTPASLPNSTNSESTWVHSGHDFYIFEDLMGHYEDESQVFMYHPEHRQLHDTFWKTIDEIFKSKGVTGIKNKRKALQLSYTIGFLMRYAFMPNTGLEPTKEDIVTPTSHPEYYARLESFARTSLMVKNYPGTPLESISNVIDEWKYNAKRTRPGKVIWKIKNVAREIILGMMT